jgi:hypothetical protein
VTALGRFLWEFVIGDDWRIAAGVAIALALTAVLEWWWLLPLAVAGLLALSVLRFAARRRRSPRTSSRSSTRS